jgi:hypothetical protein
MLEAEIFLLWMGCDDYEVREFKLADGRTERYFYPVGNPVLLRPLDDDPELFLKFAGLGSGEDDLLKLVRRNGWPWFETGQFRGLLDDAESLDEVVVSPPRCTVNNLRHVAEEFRKDFFQLKELAARRRRSNDGGRSIFSTWDDPYGEAKIGLLQKRSGKGMVLAIEPTNLINGLYVQMLTFFASGKAVRKCENCESLFTLGPPGSGGRRSQAKFCSDHCKDDWHNKRKAEKRKAEKEPNQ